MRLKTLAALLIISTASNAAPYLETTLTPDFIMIGGGATVVEENLSSIDLTTTLIFSNTAFNTRYYLFGGRLNYYFLEFNQYIEGGIGYSYDPITSYVFYSKVGALWSSSDKFKWGAQFSAISEKQTNDGSPGNTAYLFGLTMQYRL